MYCHFFILSYWRNCRVLHLREFGQIVLLNKAKKESSVSKKKCAVAAENTTNTPVSNFSTSSLYFYFRGENSHSTFFWFTFRRHVLWSTQYKFTCGLSPSFRVHKPTEFSLKWILTSCLLCLFIFSKVEPQTKHFQPISVSLSVYLWLQSFEWIIMFSMFSVLSLLIRVSLIFIIELIHNRAHSCFLLQYLFGPIIIIAFTKGFVT